MVLGYNHNVMYKGVVFHVQTEDSGVEKPHIITLLYREGTILCSQKTEYKDILGVVGDIKTEVEFRMKEQHKSMMKRLKTGEFDEKAFYKSDSLQDTKKDTAVAAKNTFFVRGEEEQKPVLTKPVPINLVENSNKEIKKEQENKTKVIGGFDLSVFDKITNKLEDRFERMQEAKTEFTWGSEGLEEEEIFEIKVTTETIDLELSFDTLFSDIPNEKTSRTVLQKEIEKPKQTNTFSLDDDLFGGLTTAGRHK